MRPPLLSRLLLAGAMAGTLGAGKFFDLPPLPPPEQYGSLLMSERSEAHGQPSVRFAHWSHRRSYACRVCHVELGFEMLANTTGVSEEANRQGDYCGACHDGNTAFGHTEKHCTTCHTGSIGGNLKQFKELRKFPKTKFGNKIDWAAAERKGMINPKKSLFDPEFEQIAYNEAFEVEADWTLIPPADFSHSAHLEWLDCANCHPDIFKIQKKGTEHFLMKYILEGRFCGACHLRVAFPLDNCKRCHPDMKG